MHPRVLFARRKFLLVLSVLGLQAGIAAGPLAAVSGIASPSVPAAEAGAPAEMALPVPGPESVATEPAPVAEVPPAQAPAAPAIPPPPADIVPPERTYLQLILVQAAEENGLPTDIIQAQAWAESSWRADAVSHKEAAGVLQITPPTVEFVSHRLLRLDHKLDPMNPADNARMGARYLRHLLERTGDFRQALIAYCQGLGALRRNGPYPEAEVYADRVLALAPRFRAS